MGYQHQLVTEQAEYKRLEIWPVNKTFFNFGFTGKLNQKVSIFSSEVECC